MLIVQAYKCPLTGKLFETEEGYLSFVEKRAAARAREQKLQARGKSRKAFADEFKSLDSFSDMEVWLKKNFVRLRRFSRTSYTGSLSRVEIGDMMWRERSWKGEWVLEYKTAFDGDFNIMLGILGIRDSKFNFSGVRQHLDGSVSEMPHRYTVGVPAYQFPRILKREIKDSIAYFKDLRKENFWKRKMSFVRIMLSMDHSRQKNKCLGSSALTNKLLLDPTDEIEIAAQMFPELDTYFEFGWENVGTNSYISAPEMVTFDQWRGEKITLTTAEKAVWLKLSGTIPPETILRNVNGPRAENSTEESLF